MKINHQTNRAASFTITTVLSQVTEWKQTLPPPTLPHPIPAVFPFPSCSWTWKKMAAAFCCLDRASTWMPEWPQLLTFDLTGEPTPTTWAACCPTALTPCLDRLPTSQNSGDMEGQVSEELSKTKSQISHTLYQSNILEAQSRSQFWQKSHRLQRWRGLRVFFPSPARSGGRIVADQRKNCPL